MKLNSDQLGFFAKYIEAETGIVYSETNFYQLESRLESISKSMSLESVQELWSHCRDGINGLTKQVILDTATNNETQFFRDKKVFDAFEKFCLPAILEMDPNLKEYKIWSAACSTGQEPYSLGMISSEMVSRDKITRMKIDATDFSERVLEYAKRGVYSQLEAQRGLPTQLLLKYFEKRDDDTWCLKAGITEKVSFSRLNLLGAWPAKSYLYDVILCRNVLIYQSVENKKKVIQKLAKALRPKGFLILGGAETLIGLSDEFDQVSSCNAVFYQKKV
jgi:chemotaxis protein methyltransferase CheR